VTVTANRFVPCGRRRAPTITVSPGGAVFSVCTSWSGQFFGGGAARAVDNAVYELARGREPDGRSAGPSGRPGLVGRRGPVL
jgi:hypothetical protein